MELKEAKRLANKHLKRLRRELGLPHWKITVEWKAVDNDQCVGLCSAWPEYENALITLNYPIISDEENFVQVLRHELLHIMHSPFQNVRQAARHWLNEADYRVFCDMWEDAAEHTVLNLERISAR